MKYIFMSLNGETKTVFQGHVQPTCSVVLQRQSVRRQHTTIYNLIIHDRQPSEHSTQVACINQSIQCTIQIQLSATQ